MYLLEMRTVLANPWIWDTWTERMTFHTENEAREHGHKWLLSNIPARQIESVDYQERGTDEHGNQFAYRVRIEA